MNILNEYEILSVIGEGTFGVVKLGKNKETGEEVAIKILEKNKIINEDDEERVKREINILKKVHHINIIKILKIEEDKDNIYLVMEFCEKGELFNHIVEEQKLDEIEAAYYYYQLINGLECIHYNEIVHRDLKPENLLLSKGYILKIIDFGLSNYFNKTKLLSTPCGSPCYASPEMVSGKKYDGFMIDIWSTGIILYAMLCGYLPFEDPDNEVLFQKILKCDAEFPEDLSEDAIDLMQKIMVTNPKERITIPKIKKHPFYLKGKKKFKSLHFNLVNEVEKNYSEKSENENNNREKEERKELNNSDEEYQDIKYENLSENKEKLEKFDNEDVFENFKELKICNNEINNEIKKKEEDKKIENEKEYDNSKIKKEEIENNENKKINEEQKIPKIDANINSQIINLDMVNYKTEANLDKNSHKSFDDLNLDINLQDLEENKLITKSADIGIKQEEINQVNKNIKDTNKENDDDINKEIIKIINNEDENDNIKYEQNQNEKKNQIQNNKKNNEIIKDKDKDNNNINKNNILNNNSNNINKNNILNNNNKRKNKINIPEINIKNSENINSNNSIPKIRNISKERDKKINEIEEKNEYKINSQRIKDRKIPNIIKFNSNNEKILNIVNDNKISNQSMKEMKYSKDKLNEQNKNKSDMPKKD